MFAHSERYIILSNIMAGIFEIHLFLWQDRASVVIDLVDLFFIEPKVA